MIIFGTRGVTYTKGQEEFHCPQCAAKAPYKHKRVRRFFSLYFIPVIPMDLHGEYVECQNCRGTFRLEVLDHDPEKAAVQFEAEFHRALKRVMVQMMLADGVVDDAEVTTIRDIYRRVTSAGLSRDDVQAEIQAAQSDQYTVDQYLAAIAPNLNDEGKELVIKGAFLVAAADGEFHDDEKALLVSIGQALAMSPMHLKGVVHSLTESATDS